jgi:UDP-GlcNAc3NAcA epimerase
MKLLTIVGARPQFIKAAAVSRELAVHPGIIESVLHTGQHYDHNMSEVFFREMNIPEPSFNLNIKSSLQGEMTGRMIEGIEKIILEERPDTVLVYGDTNSTLAGAIAASKLFVKLVHVEAGLRSHNMHMPEEINRILTDRVSDLLCCPTDYAMKNLKAEGFDNYSATCVRTGDVMMDTALYYSRISAGKSDIMKKIKSKDFILCTLHRAENTNDPQRFAEIIKALNQIHKKISIVMPLHPRTKKTIEALGLKLDVDVVEPQGYFDMLELLKHCRIVMTDSGGLQKEAYFFRKPCVTVRNETEWKELIDLGCNKLSQADETSIVSAVDEMLQYDFNVASDLYGNGNASAEIVRAIEKFL